MLSVVKLSVVMLSVVMPSVIILSVIMLSVVMLGIVMLSVVEERKKWRNKFILGSKPFMIRLESLKCKKSFWYFQKTFLFLQKSSILKPPQDFPDDV
jgi:hypothetical protein